jgi:hypothetical protein
VLRDLRSTALFSCDVGDRLLAKMAVKIPWLPAVVERFSRLGRGGAREGVGYGMLPLP